MAVINSTFFNSISQDRPYDATDLNSLTDPLVEDGVFKNYLNEFNVLSDGGLSWIVEPGCARFHKIQVRSESNILGACTTADSTYGRIDEIILTIDTNDTGRQASIDYIEGFPSASPARPPLPSGTGIYSYSLCSISVAAGTTSLTQSVFQKRVGTTETPYAKSALSSDLDTSTLFIKSGGTTQTVSNDTTFTKTPIATTNPPALNPDSLATNKSIYRHTWNVAPGFATPRKGVRQIYTSFRRSPTEYISVNNASGVSGTNISSYPVYSSATFATANITANVVTKWVILDLFSSDNIFGAGYKMTSESFISLMLVGPGGESRDPTMAFDGTADGGCVAPGCGGYAIYVGPFPIGVGRYVKISFNASHNFGTVASTSIRISPNTSVPSSYYTIPMPQPLPYPNGPYKNTPCIGGLNSGGSYSYHNISSNQHRYYIIPAGGCCGSYRHYSQGNDQDWMPMWNMLANARGNIFDQAPSGYVSYRFTDVDPITGDYYCQPGMVSNTSYNATDPSYTYGGTVAGKSTFYPLDKLTPAQGRSTYLSLGMTYDSSTKGWYYPNYAYSLNPDIGGGGYTGGYCGCFGGGGGGGNMSSTPYVIDGNGVYGAWGGPGMVKIYLHA